jgi:hypothetical protein
MKKQEAIHFHRIKHNILGGLSMGPFGKSKKEIEREEDDRKFEDYYGISRKDALINATSMGETLGTLNLDAIIKLRAPGFLSAIKDIYYDNRANKEAIESLNVKYDKILDALNLQNELLSKLLETGINKTNINIAR